MAERFAIVAVLVVAVVWLIRILISPIRRVVWTIVESIVLIGVAVLVAIYIVRYVVMPMLR